MGVTIQIKHDLDGAMARFKKMSKRGIEKAAGRAIKKAGDKTYSTFIKNTSKRTSIKQKILRQAIRKWWSVNDIMYTINAESPKARGNNLIELVAPGKRNPTAFRQRTMGRGGVQRYKSKGVTATAWGQRKVYVGSFIGKGKTSGKMLVYARTGKSRNSKLKALTGPSARRRFMRPRVQARLKVMTRKGFRVEFERLLQVEMAKV